ncbi:MAG: T9SS type A sorting domain-containing protein [Saprospiraceae bacterium]
MKKPASLVLVFCLFFSLAKAQHFDSNTLSTIEKVVLTEQDNDQLFQEEMSKRRPSRAPHFAVPIPVQVNPYQMGTWKNLANGNAVWQLRIQSKAAKSLNFGFTGFQMPRGASFVIYTTNEQNKIGPFLPADNESHNELWTPIIEAADVILEITVPIAEKNNVVLNLATVNHAFIGFGELAALSGSCNLDVVCDAADGWGVVDDYRDIIRSVGMYTLNGIQTCTGFLITNQRTDCTPYFLTANHCGINTGNDQTMVVYWNYENSTCRQPNTPASGANGNGNFNTFNMGATRRANASASDFCLVELEEPVNEDANAFMAGFNATDVIPNLAIGIHHPGTEEKRISFENDPLSPDGSYLRVNDWDIGTTEGGSSGSPIFDENKRAVGQLFGGGAACGNDLSDIYGWLNASWDGGSPAVRLKDWLDPDDTGTLIMDGTDVLGCGFSIAIEDGERTICPGEEVSFELVVSENFTADVNLSLIGLPMNVVQNFSVNPVAPGDTTILTISNTMGLSVGEISLSVLGSDNVESSNTALSIVVINTPAATTLTTPMDGETEVNLNALIAWDEVAMASEYLFELSKDISFTDIEQSTSLSNTGITVTSLAFGTDYFWRVTASNACGVSVSATATFTTLLNLTISSTPSSASVCDSEIGAFTLMLGTNFAETGVNLSAENLPMGATATFEPNPALPGSTVEVSIGNLNGVTPMTYLVKVIADDGTNSSFRNLGLIIKPNPTAAPALTTPTDGETNVSVTPSLSWNSTGQTNNYLVEVADNETMVNPLISQEVNGTGLTVPNANELGGEDEYFWRVTAQNECGGMASPVYRFTTEFTESINYLGRLAFELLPNPTSGQFQINFGQALSEALQVEIFAVNGQRMQTVQFANGSRVVDLDISNYAQGVYLVRLIYGNEVFTERIILSNARN